MQCRAVCVCVCVLREIIHPIRNGEQELCCLKLGQKEGTDIIFSVTLFFFVGWNCSLSSPESSATHKCIIKFPSPK